MSVPEARGKLCTKWACCSICRKLRRERTGLERRRAGGKRERKPGVTHPGPGGPDVSEGRITSAVPRAAENAGAERAG